MILRAFTQEAQARGLAPIHSTPEGLERWNGVCKERLRTRADTRRRDGRRGNLAHRSRNARKVDAEFNGVGPGMFSKRIPAGNIFVEHSCGQTRPLMESRGNSNRQR